MGIGNRVQISEAFKRKHLQKFPTDLNICDGVEEIYLDARFLAGEISQFLETQVGEGGLPLETR